MFWFRNEKRFTLRDKPNIGTIHSICLSPLYKYQFYFQQFTLGITSLSKLGPIGAALEVCIIFYLGATSTVGLYTMPWMRLVRPRIKQTSLSLLIINCALLLILSSAQPLLSRIVGKNNVRFNVKEFY